MPCSLERAGVQVLPALRLVAAPCHRLVPKRLADQTYPKRVGATASERRYRRRRLTKAASGPRVSDVSPFLPAVLKAPLEPAAVDIVRVSAQNGHVDNSRIAPASTPVQNARTCDAPRPRNASTEQPAYLLPIRFSQHWAIVPCAQCHTPRNRPA